MEKVECTYIVSTAYDGRRLKLYPKVCTFCEGTFYVPKSMLRRRKYCSPKCSSDARISRVQVKCAYCGDVFEKVLHKIEQSRHGIFFCCREHKDLGQRLENGIISIHPPHYGSGVHSYRKAAFRSYPHKCERCGYDEVIEVLEVHHIDGDRSHNVSDNLVILCPTCHALVTRGHLEIGENREFTWAGSSIARAPVLHTGR